jgi:hypothetical protein
MQKKRSIRVIPDSEEQRRYLEAWARVRGFKNAAALGLFLLVDYTAKNPLGRAQDARLKDMLKAPPEPPLGGGSPPSRGLSLPEYSGQGRGVILGIIQERLPQEDRADWSMRLKQTCGGSREDLRAFYDSLAAAIAKRGL